MNTKKQTLAAYLILSFFLIGTTTALQSRGPRQSAYLIPHIQEPEPTPMMGRFAIPELPENPTQVDIGENLYFYHCMPCHGDHGQGLTDEFRAAWVEDHQNCWARGCHAGRPMDEGFPIPKYVPPVIASQLIAHFPAAQKLYDYLRIEHPPQNPGILEEDEYWALTAFLWFENGQLPSGIELVPEKNDLTGSEDAPQLESKIEPEEVAQTEYAPDHPSGFNINSIGITLIGSGLLLIVLILLIRRKMNTNHSTPGSTDAGE